METTKVKGKYVFNEDFLYREHVAAPVLFPLCSCEGAYKFNGLKITANVRCGISDTRYTLLDVDGETCAFCEHYVLWAPKKREYNKKQDNVKLT